MVIERNGKFEKIEWLVNDHYEIIHKSIDKSKILLDDQIIDLKNYFEINSKLENQFKTLNKLIELIPVLESINKTLESLEILENKK